MRENPENHHFKALFIESLGWAQMRIDGDFSDRGAIFCVA